MIVRIDTEAATVEIDEDGRRRTLALSDPDAFDAVSRAWLRAGWDVKYVYGFTWLGRPIIQLPEDMVRVQEVVHALQPDVIVETGIAHGGSLIFFASLCEAIGHGRVIGVDVEIRSHNRAAIEAHRLFSRITLVEGDSVAPEVIARVRDGIGTAERVLVVLDSNHTKEHVLAELRAYAPLVSIGSYVAVADGIMRDLVGAPRAGADWGENNPLAAIEEFLRERDDFVADEPDRPFNEGAVEQAVTYWPHGWLRRVR